MHSDIIQVYRGQLKIGTWDLARGCNIQHRLLKKIIKEHPEQFGESAPKLVRPTKKKGGQIDEYLLNEEQIRILFAHLLNHTRMKMGLRTCIFKQFDSEMHFFKMLEEYFDEIKKIK